jgi:alpha-ribazole phosphatase
MESSGIIYLVRHCATPNDEANYPILLGQKGELGLSEKGREHAAVLADYFGGKGIKAVYASPSARAVQTARVINDTVEGNLTFCSSLLEVDMGRWEGLTYEQLGEDDPDNFAAYLRDPGTYGYPGGENLSQVCRRGLGFIEMLAAEHPNERIVVVTHKYVNRAVLAHLMGLPMHRLREIDQDPGCVNVIRVFRGVMELQAVNYTSNFELAEEDSEPCDSSSSTRAVSA